MISQNQTIANYYNQTQNHYERWWGLADNLSLHYGIWDKNTVDFKEALSNTNSIMHAHIGAPSGVSVLDAGCGVGGAAIYLASQHNCKVAALTLSDRQIQLARSKVKELHLEQAIDLQLMDFTQTSFQANSFDVVWACESVCHTHDKNDFIKEAYRLLKPGGKLIMADFFLPDLSKADPHQWIKKWANTWGVPHFSESVSFNKHLRTAGFKNIQLFDYTKQIKKSARKMYLAALLGAIPSTVYNLLHPKVSPFAKTHYKSGIYQYKALKANLWEYCLLTATK